MLKFVPKAIRKTFAAHVTPWEGSIVSVACDGKLESDVSYALFRTARQAAAYHDRYRYDSRVNVVASIYVTTGGTSALRQPHKWWLCRAGPNLP